MKDRQFQAYCAERLRIYLIKRDLGPIDEARLRYLDREIEAELHRRWPNKYSALDKTGEVPS